MPKQFEPIFAKNVSVYNKPTKVDEDDCRGDFEASLSIDEAKYQERIHFRENQSLISRLTEYITGFHIEEPRLPERICRDHELIRFKYSLPSRMVRVNSPSEYERVLRERARALGILIRPKSDCGVFFKENQFAGGVFLSEERSIGADVNRNTKEKYRSSLITLEHEIIHAAQSKNSPGMPIELQEYEAYIAGINPDFFHGEDKEKITEGLAVLFQMIEGSVYTWYRLEGKKRGCDLKPEWENPKYFLEKVDRTSLGGGMAEEG